MRTPLQRQASKVNGAKSKGPKSPETRAISSQNALKHGLMAKKLSLPDEDAVERQESATRIARELNPQSELQHHLVDCVNNAIDRQKRCARALHGKLTKQQRSIRRRHKRKIARQVEEGMRLFHKGCPWKAVLLLRRTAEGCRWLRKHWIDIRDRLARHGIMSEPELRALLRLHGEPLDEMSLTPLICDLVYLAVGTWPTKQPFDMTIVLRSIPPSLVEQYRSRWVTCRAHAEELLRYIEAGIAELDARIVELEAEDEADLEDAALDAMMIADPKEADLHLRYGKDADRALIRALEEFWALKEREAELGSGDEDDDVADEDESGLEDESPPPVSEPVGSPSATAAEVLCTPAEGAASDISRNEPGAPVGETFISSSSEGYVANSGISSDLSAGLGDPAHAAWLASIAVRPPGRPTAG
jgi:hypothetical protein